MLRAFVIILAVAAGAHGSSERGLKGLRGRKAHGRHIPKGVAHSGGRKMSDILEESPVICATHFSEEACPPGTELVPHPEQKLCGKIEGEWECTPGECCWTTESNCATDLHVPCPAGTELIPDPHLNRCDDNEEECNTDACCWTPNTCLDFAGTCPMGTELIPDPGLQRCEDNECTPEECC